MHKEINSAPKKTETKYFWKGTTITDRCSTFTEYVSDTGQWTGLAMFAMFNCQVKSFVSSQFFSSNCNIFVSLYNQ